MAVLCIFLMSTPACHVYGFLWASKHSYWNHTSLCLSSNILYFVLTSFRHNISFIFLFIVCKTTSSHRTQATLCMERLHQHAQGKVLNVNFIVCGIIRASSDDISISECSTQYLLQWVDKIFIHRYNTRASLSGGLSFGLI